jgi:hypothetical protein
MIIGFMQREFIILRPTHKLEDHPLQTFRDCLLSIYSQLPSNLEDISSIRNLKTRHTWWKKTPNMVRKMCHMRVERPKYLAR